MAITTSRRKNVIRAIRRALFINFRDAARIVDENWFSMPAARPLHKVVASVGDIDPHSFAGDIQLYVPDDDGEFTWITSFNAFPGSMRRIATCSLEEAYCRPGYGMATLVQADAPRARHTYDLPLAA